MTRTTLSKHHTLAAHGERRARLRATLAQKLRWAGDVSAYGTTSAGDPAARIDDMWFALHSTRDGMYVALVSACPTCGQLELIGVNDLASLGFALERENIECATCRRFDDKGRRRTPQPAVVADEEEDPA